VRHENSVFHALVQQIPWAVFERLVAAHGADARVRRLPTKSQLIALLYAQFGGAASLRETVDGLRSHAARLYHLGAKPVCRSTLADANAHRPATVFTELLAEMLHRAHRGLRRAVAEATLLIDSTSLALNARSGAWARFSATACGAKLHVIDDPQAAQPLYAAISPARVNDITVAQAMPIQPGATYVFDLGYYDYAWWAQLDRAQCRIVTRIKRRTQLAVIETRALPPGSAILADRIGFLPARQSRNRHNPMADAVREIRVRTPTGKELRILSNDLDAPAQQIAELYRRRWQIELFFRWIKQTLKISRFLGTSENAVRIQVAVALIAYLLLRLAHAPQRAVPSPTAFARLVRANLMHRRHIAALLQPPPQQPAHPRQAQFNWLTT
jgi:transposase